MKIKYHLYHLLTGLFLLLMAGCATKRYERPALANDQLYREVIPADSLSIGLLSWKELFKDPVLQQLIDRGLAGNTDLKIAIERIQIAAANLQLSRGALLPSVQADVSVTDNKQSRAALNFPPGININLETQTYRAQLSTSWEIDVWGKLSSAKRSALASLLQSEAAKRAVQTQLVANIAQLYYQLLALDEQSKITSQTIDIRRRNVSTMKDLKESAIVTGAAVAQSEANLYAAEVGLIDLKRSIRETENALSVLIGVAPGEIRRGTLADQSFETRLGTGYAVQMLSNRPDVEAAELGLRAAFEQTNAAKRYFYPSLTLTASGGLSTLQLQNFFDQSVFYNLVGGLTQPIFARNQNKARLKTAEAQQQIALLNFQQILLNAGQEVSNALYAYETAVEKEETREKQIVSLEKAVDFTQELLRYSSATNYTDVLTSEQSLLSAQLSGSADRLQKLQAVVNLYKALGGGWK